MGSVGTMRPVEAAYGYKPRAAQDDILSLVSQFCSLAGHGRPHRPPPPTALSLLDRTADRCARCCCKVYGGWAGLASIQEGAGLGEGSSRGSYGPEREGGN